MQKKQPYVLWLPSWYPNKINPFDGDFIQRHARAAALYREVHVFIVVRDKFKKVTGSIRVETNSHGNLTETVVYFHQLNGLLKMISEKAGSFLQYRKLFKYFLENEIFFKKGLPVIQHVHIAYKAGLIATWIKKKYKIPFILTEQWTIYLPEANPNFSQLDLYVRRIIHHTIKHAKLILPVSEYLMIHMKNKWHSKHYQVVPNVVDTKIFYPIKKDQNKKLKFIHISNLSYQKNPEALFESFQLLKQSQIDFELHLFGSDRSEIKEMIKDFHLQNNICLHGEEPHQNIIKYLQNSDFLILYSRYETFGCVLIEANACGVPVIVTDNNLMHELVKDKLNGVFVKPESPKALFHRLFEISKGQYLFDKFQIAETVIPYTLANVGKQLSDIYNQILDK